MNILIITPFYKHDRNIASVRWTNIGTRLAKRHNVIIVTQPHDDMDMKTTIETDEDGILVARINQKTGYEKLAVRHFGGATGDDWQTAAGAGESEQINDNAVRKLKNRALYSSMQIKAKSYAKEIAKNVIPKGTKIDVVISSACPFIEMLFGYELKKLLGCKWISDFRDLPFQEDNCDDTHIEKRIMQKVLPKADAITVVVSCMINDLCKTASVDKTKIHIVTNGFSLADKKELKQNDDRKLHILHTGSLYGGRRRADLLFAALEQLKNEGITDFVFECAGGNNSTLYNTAKKYDCLDFFVDHGFVSRERAMELQGNADCLVALVEPYALPAKLFEYVLSQRNIICIALDQNATEHEARAFIEKLNVGKVFAESSWDKDVARLIEYLVELVKQKECGKKIAFEPNRQEVSKFDHDNISLKVEKIIESIL